MSIGAYLHIPFCSHKCEFCDFAAFEGLAHLEDEYCRVLAGEIAARLIKNPVDGQKLHSIFYGGGTPGLIAPANLQTVHHALLSRVALADLPCEVEITLETTPHAITVDKARAWRELGINRLSIGVESFSDQELVSIGRDHTVSQALSGIESAMEAGFENICLDFMYGLPTQTLESWMATLTCFADLARKHAQIRHFSAYGLHLAANSPLYSRFPRDSSAYPEDELFASMYDDLVEIATASGFEQYEVSNFAKPGFQSRHNLSYWTGDQYLGFGVSAHRYLGGVRSSNWRSLRRYMRDCLGDEMKEEIDAETRMKEAIMLGLRLRAGINLSAFASAHGFDLSHKFKSQLAKLEEGGLIEVTDQYLRITHKGVPVSNSIICEFF